MKKIIMILCFVLLIAMMVSCGENGSSTDSSENAGSDSKTKESPTKPEDDVDSHKYVEPGEDAPVEMLVKPGEDGSYVLTIRNNSKEQRTYGNPFYIEKYEDGEWIRLSVKESVGENETFTDESYVLDAGQEVTHVLMLGYLYDLSAPGKYRIVKTFVAENGNPGTDILMQYAEFEVK